MENPLFKMYTLDNKKEIESQIQDHLEIIKKEALLKLKVKSIVLIGTFSRGEGAVFISKKAAIPTNDYDLYLIVDKQPHENIIFSLQEKCVKKIKEYILKKTDEKSLLRGFNVDFKCLTPNEIKNLPPLLRFYDMRNVKIIYGEDFLKLLPKYESVSLSEGLRLIFNETSHIFEYISEEKFDSKLNYFLSKAYLSIMTSFLIYKKDLGVSILQNQKNIKKYKLPIKDFHGKLEKYVQLRLKPPRKMNNSEVRENFFEVQKDLKIYLKFYVSKFFRVSSKDSWIEISKKMKKRLYKEYYSPYFVFFSKKYLKVKPPKFVLHILSYMAQYYFSYKFAIHLKNLKKPYLKKFLEKDPGLVIMATLPLILTSLKRKGVDEKIMNETNKNLNRIINSSVKDWEELREKYVKIYKLYFWQKFI